MSLMGYMHRDSKTDMWSFGMILAAVVFRKIPFLNEDFEIGLIKEIINVSLCGDTLTFNLSLS